MNEIDKIISLARKEIGTKADANNIVKYNVEYCGTTDVPVKMRPWCVEFIWWLFKHSGFSKLFYNGKKCASCTTLYNYWGLPEDLAVPVKEAKKGDMIIFQFGDNRHIGYCIDFDGRYVTTIDGNTCEDGKEWNGYSVMERRRPVSYIKWVIRPPYSCEKQAEDTKEYYTVKSGDNLTKIAKMYGYKSYKELLPLNPEIKNPNLIRVNQKVRVK